MLMDDPMTPMPGDDTVPGGDNMPGTDDTENPGMPS
jgi:hypothetical protein